MVSLLSVVKVIPTLSLVCALAAGALGADTGSPINLSQPVPIVRLSDGRIIHNLAIVSFGTSTVMAKWDGGRGTIPYDALPADLKAAAQLHRPAAAQSTAAGAAGSPASAAGSPKSTSLSAARRGFSTHLIRFESTGGEPDKPPAGVLDLVTYPSALGPLPAYVSPPTNDGKQHPAIIWLVGGGSGSIDAGAWTPGPPENDQSASELRNSGIIMMYPSLRGGNANPGYHEKFYGEVDDVIAAGRFLAQLSYVDPKRIYLGGHSTGGTLALLVAESTDQFRAVFSLGPRADMLGYKGEELPYDPSIPKEMDLRAPKLWLDSIRSRTFVFEGTEPPSNIDELREMAALDHNPLVQFRAISGGTHFTIISPIVREIAEQIEKDE